MTTTIFSYVHNLRWWNRMNEQATGKLRCSMLCTNSAIFVLPAEVLMTDLDSLTLISYSCSVVTTVLTTTLSHFVFYRQLCDRSRLNPFWYLCTS